MPDEKHQLTDTRPQDVNGNVRDKLIAHLTEEIKTLTASQITFRHRLGFSTLLGPFLVMSSVLIATDGKLSAIDWHVWNVLAAIGAVVVYMLLALFGGLFERYANKQTKHLRATLHKVARNETISAADFQYDQDPIPAYLSSFALALLAFLFTSYLLFQLLPET